MLRQMPKKAYLADLQAGNDHNRQVVESIFVPLDQTERSWQPTSKEWSVDQCFQHLVLSFETFEPNTRVALHTPEPPNSDGIFHPNWLVRKTLPASLNPKWNLPTVRSFNPTKSSHPDVLTRFLAQQDRLSAMIEQAAQADLQVKCWYFKRFLTRFNLGEFLYFFVSHDELHIDQAQRVLAAYKQRSTV